MESDTTTPTSQTTWIEILAWMDVNRKRLIAGAAAAAVLVVLVAVYVWHNREHEVEANKALFALRPVATGFETPVMPKAESYFKVADDFKGTTAAEMASLIGARVLFEDGKYSDAQTAFQNFIARYPRSSWIPEAALGVAACLDAQNKVDEAIAKYQEVSRNFPNSSVVSSAKLALAHVLEGKGQAEEALKAIEPLATGGGRGAGQSAASYRDYLLKKFPQLVKTNAPVAVVPPKPAPAPLAATPVASNAAVVKPVPLMTTLAGATNAATAATKPTTNATTAPVKPATNAAPTAVRPPTTTAAPKP